MRQIRSETNLPIVILLYNLLTKVNILVNRIADSKKYIDPQKNFADMVVNFFSKNNFDTGLEGADVNIGLKISISASIYIEDLIEALNSNEITWDYNDDLNSQYIILNKYRH